MLDVKESYKKLLDSQDFKKGGYLCSAFVMAKPEEVMNSFWQLDFYDAKKDRMSSYAVKENIELLNTESEVFKDEKTKIEELDLDEVEVKFEDAFEMGKKLIKEKHETPNKVIVVLQKNDVTFWNLSFLTEGFNLINIRIDAKEGKVLDEKRVSLLSFKGE